MLVVTFADLKWPDMSEASVLSDHIVKTTRFININIVEVWSW